MYLKDDNLLPVLNNQVPTANSSSYKRGMEEIKTLFLAEATEDSVVYPYQSETFGQYAWATSKANPTTLDFLQGEQYSQDYLGLKERYDKNSSCQLQR